jgi:thioredoxin-related protein
MYLLLRFYYSVLIIAAMLLSFSVKADEPVSTQKSPEINNDTGSHTDVFNNKYFKFNDTPLNYDLELPDWFKLSFLELNDDVDDARKEGKKGIIVYFGQKRCPYCQAQLKYNWGNPAIVAYTRKYFDVIAINVQGDRPVADTNGKIYRTEKAFAHSVKAQFTPTLIFYNTNGKEIRRISGFHPPYQFNAALEYIVDGYYKTESLKSYMARATAVVDHGKDKMDNSVIFSPAPYQLNRSRVAAKKPLAVFFEKPNCHACDILHTGPLSNKDTLKLFRQLENVQLDIGSDTAVITPGGKNTTAKAWANQLDMYYTPTILFFDEKGKEVIKIDSVVGFYRLNNVLHYILSKGYIEEPNFQQWREHHQR